MRIFLVYICILFVGSLFAQTPYGPDSSATITSGTYTITGTNIHSTQHISGYTAITYLAKKQVHLTDGFASGYGADQHLHAKIDSNILFVADMTKGTNPWNPKKYERFEMGIQLPAYIQNQIDTFLVPPQTPGRGINPYDPDQIKIKVDFTQGSTTNTRYGFYYKEYDESGNDWVYKPNPYTFRVRYAPPATGTWSFTIHVFVGTTEVNSFTGNFDVQGGSDNNGFLDMTNGNYRRFKFTESGNIFFGMGEDIGYAEQDDGITNSHGVVTPYNAMTASANTWNTMRTYMSDLAANGGNFLRTRLDPWSTPIESQDKQIFPNDPDTIPLAHCLNNYDHNQKNMSEFDSTLALAENKGLYMMLTILDDQYFSPSTIYGLNGYTWDNHNPYYKLVVNGQDFHDRGLGDVTGGIYKFFTDSTAINYYKKTLFYIMARWGYSPHIALWEQINETDKVGQMTDAHGKDIGTYYKNDPTVFASSVKSWVTTMQNYMQGFYPFHLQTTGYAGNALAGPTSLNVWTEHHYGNAINENINVRSPASLNYWNNYLPFIIGEVGSDCSTGIDIYGDREYHNSIWAGTFSGSLTTPLNWNDWQETGGVHHRGNFVGLSNYIANSGINFNQVLKPVTTSLTATTGADFYNFYLVDAGANHAWGWAQSAEHYWQSDVTNTHYNTDTTITHHCSAPNVTCYSVGGYVTIALRDFNTYTKYRIDYYNTSTGANIGNDEITLFWWTDLNYTRNFDCAGNADVAYYISNQGGALRTTDDTAKSVTIPADTIYVSQNPYCVSAVGGIDNYLTYSYHWNYGNGHGSTDTTACITYGLGTYTLQLSYVNDVGDTVRTINQILVVLDTSGTISGRVAAVPPTTYAGSNIYSPVSHVIKVYPNPAQNTLYITNETGIEIKDCQLIDMLGNVFSCGLQSNKTINISNLAPGSYYLHLNTVSGASIFKIIKTD